MKVVILAAGMGQRLHPLTEEIPKCLLGINGKTVLERIIENCLSFNITDFVFVVGHGKEAMYRAKVQIESQYPIQVILAENADYNSTNTGVSLDIALNGIRDDVIVINGDNVFDKRILQALLQENGTALVIDNSKVLVDESFKVKIVGNSIELMGKTIPLSEANGEFIGISVINEQDLDMFKKILKDMVESNKNIYYDFAFQKLSSVKPVSFVFTNGLKWTEIDTEDDLILARKIADELG